MVKKTLRQASHKDIAFRAIAPKILYFGTPVAITSANEDGNPNLAPISSFWALGWTIVLGLLRDTKTLAENPGVRRENMQIVMLGNDRDDCPSATASHRM